MAKKPAIDRERFVPFLLEAITNRIAAHVTRLYQGRFGVGLAEWRVIAAIAVEPRTTAMDISEQSCIDPGAISRVVFSLTERGFVSQAIDPLDRRRRCLDLTGAGRKLHDDMLKVALIEEEKLLRDLTPEQHAGFIATLRTLYARSWHKHEDPILATGRSTRQAMRQAIR